MDSLDRLFTNKEYQKTTLTIPCFEPANPDNNGDNDDQEVIQLQLLCSQAATTDYDLTGQIVWPVSMLLAHFLASKLGQKLIQDRNIVELGAGCGVPGLVASKYGKNVVLTDGNDLVIDLLEKNVKLQQQQNPYSPNRCFVQKFMWGTKTELKQVLQYCDDSAADVVIAADVVQWPAVVEPFLHSVKALLWKKSQSSSPILILGIVNRAQSTFDLFFSCAAKLGFTWTRIQMKDIFRNGEVPPTCQEYGGRETQLFQLVLSDKSKTPILLAEDSKDTIVGESFENTAFLPC